MDHRFMPETAVPFPRSADQASCPDLHASDLKDVSVVRSSATNLMDQQVGHVTARPHSLRWLHVPTHAQDSTPLRFSSIASATTYTSSLRYPDDNSIQGENLADSTNEVLLPPDVYLSHQMASKRVSSPPVSQQSILRHVARPFSRKKSVDLLSLNSAGSSPVTPTTPLFPSNPAIADFTTRPFPDAEPYSKIDRYNFSKGASNKGFPQDEELTGRLRKVPRDLPVEHEEISTFHPHRDMTLQQLQHAQNLDVLDQEGKKVRFGVLWQDQPTCVIFIRHFWCASCMDYMRSIKEQVDPDVLDNAGVRLVIISNGSPAMIKSYTKIFNLPFPLYTDPTCALYRALGMTLRTADGGPDSERGDYIRHGAATGVAMVLKNAFNTRMPLHKRPGDVKQLGGEFVLGPGLRCSFVSRMHNTRSHTSVRGVLSAAGVQVDLYQRTTPQTFYDNEEQWMKDRETELKRIQARKGIRRGFMGEHRDSGSSDIDRDSVDVGPLPYRVARELSHIKESPDGSEMD